MPRLCLICASICQMAPSQSAAPSAACRHTHPPAAARVALPLQKGEHDGAAFPAAAQHSQSPMDGAAVGAGAAAVGAARPKLAAVIWASLGVACVLLVAGHVAQGSLRGGRIQASAGAAWRMAARGCPPCNASLVSGLQANSSVAWQVLATTQLAPNGSAWETAAARTRLELRHCALRRFTPAEARKCLAGRPLVVIGDSLSRYQYMSLIYFLEFGAYPNSSPDTAQLPSVVYQPHGSKNMNAYYNGELLGRM